MTSSAEPQSEPPDRVAGAAKRAASSGWMGRLARVGDTPHRTAAAFGFGVFLSFSPLFGLQIAIGIGAAMLLRLNRIAVVIGLCSNLPWLMVPWYAVTTAAGAAILGVPIAADFTARLKSTFAVSVYSREFWIRIMDLMGPLLGSFILGSSVGAVLLGGIAYLVTARLLARALSSDAPGKN
jgi:uncharacterized protein (DUF2062 family)